jgi:hypothetical protein
MVNTEIKELQNKIADLEKQLAEKENQKEQFKQLNNEEIREWIISILGNPSDMDEKAIDAVMYHCNQENWSKFCEWNPAESIRKNLILNTYRFEHYYNLTKELYGVRDDARGNILLNLIKLNSEESKELFRKWINEGKLEDTITTKRVLENGYEEDWRSCYSYLDIRHLSLDELISSWNELTVNAFKEKEEYKGKTKELEARVGELEHKDEVLRNRDEELEVEKKEKEELKQQELEEKLEVEQVEAKIEIPLNK